MITLLKALGSIVDFKIVGHQYFNNNSPILNHFKNPKIAF